MMVMSNHLHLVVYDRDGRFPAFLHHFHGTVARALNCHWGRWENFWAAEQTSAVHLVEPQDVFGKQIYALCNPVESRLVTHVTHWPGANSSTLNSTTRPSSSNGPSVPERTAGAAPSSVTRAPFPIASRSASAGLPASRATARRSGPRTSALPSPRERKGSPTSVLPRASASSAARLFSPSHPSTVRGHTPHAASSARASPAGTSGDVSRRLGATQNFSPSTAARSSAAASATSTSSSRWAPTTSPSSALFVSAATRVRTEPASAAQSRVAQLGARRGSRATQTCAHRVRKATSSRSPRRCRCFAANAPAPRHSRPKPHSSPRNKVIPLVGVVRRISRRVPPRVRAPPPPRRRRPLPAGCLPLRRPRPRSRALQLAAELNSPRRRGHALPSSAPVAARERRTPASIGCEKVIFPVLHAAVSPRTRQLRVTRAPKPHSSPRNKAIPLVGVDRILP
jgi:hypothetical protein